MCEETLTLLSFILSLSCLETQVRTFLMRNFALNRAFYLFKNPERVPNDYYIVIVISRTIGIIIDFKDLSRNQLYIGLMDFNS